MANEFYDHTTYPSTGASGSSSAMRAELNAIEAGFDKLPTLTGNGGEIIAVNSGATALEAITTTGTGSGVRATSPTLVTPVLGTPSSGTLTNCTGLPLAGVVDSTTEALGVGSLEVGHASDTTITRTGAGAIAVEGVAVLLSGGALGTPSSGTLTNCTGLPVNGIVDDTTSALGVGSIELGHASDTTITRASAGVMAVEGVNVLTTATGAALAGSTSQAFSVANLTMLQGNYGAFAVGEWSRSANYGTYYKAPSGAVADMALVSNDGATVWRLQSDGVFIATPTLSGYTTGAGGTVTQATSKSTAVTLNKPCGQITMNNAALAGGAAVTFEFNNSLISASDVVNITTNWGAAVYRAQVYYTTAGQCAIQIINTTGGSLSDAVVLNFAIIKVATA